MGNYYRKLRVLLIYIFTVCVLVTRLICCKSAFLSSVLTFSGGNSFIKA